MSELQNGLPPGWDSKFDEMSGTYYYINHYTRTTTWEDPRNRHRPLQNTPKHLAKIPVEHIPLQHGSPEIRRNYVYPSHSPPIQAFQMNSKSIPLQEMKSSTRSPLTLRSARVQDSSFTSSHSSTDSDDSVAKISAMFPTVSETHIKLLLKKYMKSIFPNADETIILECLQNNENSIQKTSEILREMGYSKKETVKPATPKVEPRVVDNLEVEPNKPKPPSPALAMKTNEEKQLMKGKLQEQYKDVPEHLICIALESVNFDEKRANQILQIMKQEDSETQNNNKNKITEQPRSEIDEAVASTSHATQLPISQSRQSIKSILKSEKKDDVSSFSRILDGNSNDYKSANLSNTMGHNPEYSKGPNEKLLLEHYIQWQGSNKSLQNGPQGVAKGPSKIHLSSKLYTPCGPNANLRIGSTIGLAKGSLFTQIKAVIVGESRVK